MYRKLLLILAIVIIFTSLSMAQESVDINDILALKKQLEQLQKDHELKLAELEKLITSIKTKLDAEEQEDMLQKLLEEAQQLTNVVKEEEDNIGKKFHTGVRQQSGLNPNFSISGDFFAGYSSADSEFLRTPGDLSYGNNRFRLRELELNMQAPLDPFTRGKAYFSITREGIALEEVYMTWLNLPGRLNLKFGKFNAEYGLLNRYHDHALPQFDRPKVLVNMFSNLSFGGYGVSGNVILPKLFLSDATNLDISILSNAGAGYSFTTEGKYNLAYVANLTNFYDITQNTFFEWRVATIIGHNDPAEKYLSYVNNFSFEVKWLPVDRAKYREVDWKNEIIFNRRNTPGDPLESMGFYSSLQNKINSQWWISGRIGYSEIPYDPDQNEWSYTGCVDFWQSEFVLVRGQYQYNRRNLTNLLNNPGIYPNDSTFTFHVSWAMGPHKHEKY